jgi:hypothetical protein
MSAAIDEGYLWHFQARVAQDAIQEATAAYWLRRAETFEWAKPRLDDFHGQATKAELSAAWKRCHASAEACRNRARVARMGGDFE